MCGILGAFNLNIEKSLLQSCLNRLMHRGPDGAGCWYDDVIWLGHRRLAILDLSLNGKQPMTYLDDRYVITYNGEVYNYIELRKELENLGYRFFSSTDTEVVLAAFSEWKEGCLHRFNGMFAFAIWDTVTRRLFLARDRFGIKPLYYIEEEGKSYQMAFASEMKCLIPLINKPSYNEDLLRNKECMLSYEGTEECIVNEIVRFPAAHYAWVTTEGITFKRWWNTLDHLAGVPQRYEDQVELFRELFTSACRLRMRSDVGVGTALSGGIDSSAVMSTMAYIMKDETQEKTDFYRAFVATFPNTSIDEKPYAEAVVNFHDFAVDYVEISYDTLLDNLARDMYYFEDVYLTPPCTMSMIYHQMKNKSVSVTIDGHGADELFCGYDMDIRTAFYDTKPSLAAIRSVAETYMGLLSREGETLLCDNLSCWRMYRPYIVRKIKTALRGKNLFECPVGENCDTWNKLDFLNQNLYLRTHQNVLPTLLRNYDRYSMMNGVEIRMPFLDYRIVEFAFSINWQSKIRNGYTKSIVRDGMRGRIPQKVVERKNKIGFSSPLLEWFRGPLREYVQDIVSSHEFANSDLLNTVQVQEKLRNIIQNPKATQLDAEDLWMQLQPALWKKYFWDKAVLF